jgi:hypothetical protein
MKDVSSIANKLEKKSLRDEGKKMDAMSGRNTHKQNFFS